MKCSKCKKEKAVLKPNGKSTGFCKPCKKKYAQIHYQTNKAAYIDRARARTIQVRAQLQAIVCEEKNKPCLDCKQKFHPWQMDFDHINDDKVDGIAKMVTNGVSEEVLRVEMAKCEVVCACCHRDRTYRRQSGINVASKAV